MPPLTLQNLSARLTREIRLVQEQVDAVVGGGTGTGATIDDTTASLITVYSSTKTNAAIAAAVSALVATAPTALDTLNELAAALGNDPSFATTMTTALSNRVRFDAAQTLTAPQQAQARSNIGAGTSSLAIGTTASDAKAGNYQPASTDITDGTATGRSLLTAADAATARSAIGAGTSNLALGTTSATAKAGNYAPAAADISDATATGRAVLLAANAAAARTAIGAGTSSLAIGTTSADAKAGDYQPTAANISDSTATGRSVLTAATAAAARTAIGAGTSSLAIGTTASDAKAGNYQPTAANISDSTATGRSLITAADAATARSAIGAGTSSLAIGTTAGTAAEGNDSRLSDARVPVAHTHPSTQISDTTTVGRAVMTAVDAAAARSAIGVGTGTTVASTDISDSTATGRSVLTAASAAAARTAIGAGTSSLAIGTTASDAKAGNYQPTAANISDSTATGRSVLTAADAAAARTAIGAGTSSLVIGTTAGTAKDGAYQPAAANISDATAIGRSILTAADAAAERTLIGVDTYMSSTIGVPLTGWALWNDATYENLAFYIQRDGTVMVSGTIKYVGGTGATLKIITFSGNYIPKGPRIHNLNGNVQGAYRQLEARSDGLWLTGATPTVNNYVTVNGTYPGAASNGVFGS